MFLSDLYDNWFPPLQGIKYGSTLRPIIWITTTAPLILFVLYALGALMIFIEKFAPPLWSTLMFLLLLISLLPLTILSYKKIVDYLLRHPKAVILITKINTVLIPPSVTYFHYANETASNSEFKNWLELVFVFLLSAIVAFFLGKWHRDSLDGGNSPDQKNATIVESTISQATGFVIPRWLKMHFRYLNQSIMTWVFVMFLPGMVFTIIFGYSLSFIVDNLVAYFKLDPETNLINISEWGLIAISFMLWSIVVYLMEKNLNLRRILFSLLFVILAGLQFYFSFTDQEFLSEPLTFQIFATIFILILILLGCGSGFLAVDETNSTEYDYLFGRSSDVDA